MAFNCRCLKQCENLSPSNQPSLLCRIQPRMVCSPEPCQISVFSRHLDFMVDSHICLFINGIAECTAEDAFKHAGENIVFGSGSPFENVDLGISFLQCLSGTDYCVNMLLKQ